MTLEAYPLAWPQGWKRAAFRARSDYRVTFTRTREQVLRSLRLLGAVHGTVVLSSNIPIRLDGLPYANSSEPSDPGIAVYWSVRKKGGLVERVMACDAWRTTRENLRAIGLSLEALRMLERAGATEIVDRAFGGFAALPPASTVRAWYEVLGFFIAPGSLVQAEVAYRDLAKLRHPDAGGSHETMIELNAAREQARSFYNSR